MSLPSPTALAHAIRFDGATADELALQHATNRQRIVDQLACGGFDATGCKHNGQVQGQRRRRLKDSDSGHRGGYTHGSDRPVSTKPARYGPPRQPRDPGIDWNADAKNGVQTKPRCRWCDKPADDLVDDMCPGCREAAAERFRVPDTPELEAGDIGEEVIPADVTPEPEPAPEPEPMPHAPRPRFRKDSKLAPHVEDILRRYRAGDSTVVLGRAYGVSPASITQLLKRLGEPRRSLTEALQRDNRPPKEGKQGKPTTRSSAPRANQASSSTGRAPEAGPSATEEEAASVGGSGDAPLPTEVAHPLPRDCMEWARLLDETRHTSDPVVRTVRQAVLTALAALDFVAHPIDSPAAVQLGASPSPSGGHDAKASQAAAGAPTEGRRRASHIDHADLVRRYNDGQTIPAIAEATGHGRMTIRRHLTDAGVQLRDDRKTHSGGGNRIEAYPADLVERIRRLYVEQRLSQAEVAQHTGISLKVVQTVMARHSITARPAAHIAGVRPGVDRSRSLKDRIEALGVTSIEIKVWAHENGLITSIRRGLPKSELVTAYEAAHNQQRSQHT